MSTLEEEAAVLALTEHAVKLGQFVQGHEPPAIVENEAEARRIYTGIAHLRQILNAQRELIATYEEWAEVARPRMAILNALIADSPALEAWRKATTADRRAPLLARMGAWELTAVICEAEGNLELARAAKQNAKHIAPRPAPPLSMERHAAAI